LPESIVGTDVLDAMFSAAYRVCILVHSHPDGDAIGSSTALCSYLRDVRGKECTVIFPDSPSSVYGFLLGKVPTVTASVEPLRARNLVQSADLLVCMDMNSASRADGLYETFAASTASKLLIDHHQNPDEASFDLVFSTVSTSSASELLYWLLLSLPGVRSASSLPLLCAESLLTGMTCDTNNFANSVFPSTFEMASGLLAAGVDRDAVLLKLYGSYRENRVRAMGGFLSEKLKITPDGAAYMVIMREDWERYSLEEGETEAFVNIPLSIARVRMSLFLREDDGFFRVSVRSRKGVSASTLARDSFHGGGHENAAGGKLFFPADIPSRTEAEAYIEEVTARFLQTMAPLRTQTETI